MLDANDMKADLGRVLEQEQLEGVFPSFYQAIGDDTDGDGLVINLTVIEWDLSAAQEDTKERIEQSLHRLYYKDSCFHEHDCCGCWFTSRARITVEPTCNIYGSESACYDVTAMFGYGRNV